MNERVPMTPEGHRQLQAELKHCKSVERPRIIQAIEVARAHGDLSENAEYDAAKEAQQQLDQRMREIEDSLAGAQVIHPSEVSGDKVVFSAKVTLTDLNRDTEVTYQIVGKDEADLSQGKLSVIAPLARAMIGKKVGDFFSVKAPGGEREYIIEGIAFE